MNYTDVIKRPILSEKSYAQMQFVATYTFEVDKRANKTLVKEAVTKLFGVKVDQVNIMNTPKQGKRVGKYAGFKSGFKKAVVKLAPGQQLGNPNEVSDSTVNVGELPKEAPKKAKATTTAPKADVKKVAAPAKAVAPKAAPKKPTVNKTGSRGK